MYEPFQPTIGRIVSAWQGTNSYDVVTDFGRYRGVYYGNSRGPSGAQESGGLTPGSFCWVLFGEGEFECHILGPAVPPWRVDPASDPQQLAVSPQVSGFRLEVGLTGRLYKLGLGGIQNHPLDVGHDLVNGEWAISSPHGPGVGVELFRSWIRGSPMTGVTCFDDLLRITGLDYEFITLAQSDYDRRHGNAIVQLKSRILYPDEALQNSLARELNVSGALHGGEHRFIAPQGPAGQNKARPALSHEFRGLDGTLAFTSARAVVLRRSTAIRIPEESRPAGEGALLGDQPLDADDARQKALQGPPPTVHVDPSATDGISWIQHTLDTIASELNIRGRSGFDRLPVQWPPPSDPPTNTLLTEYDSAMWRRLPQSFPITIDAIEGTKKFYLGESLVCLNPDGSIVIQDAHHSQILMSGGNIMLSAAHDIILAPGRNLVGIAGNDLTVKSGRHLDIASNEGRVSIKAETQLGLLGGNGGAEGGVLIESRATSEGVVVGTGTDQNIGGIFLKSATGLYGQGSRVSLDATSQDLIMRASGAIVGLATQCEFELAQGMLIFKDDQATGGAYALTPTGCSIPASIVINGQVEALGSGFFDGSLIVSDSVAAGGQVIGSSVSPAPAGDKTVDNAAKIARAIVNGTFTILLKSAQSVARRIAATLSAKLPLNRTQAALTGFSFGTSEQLRYVAQDSFKLPETLWQTISRRTKDALQLGRSKPWVEKPVVSPSGDNRSTAPSPGWEAWTVNASYQLDDHDRYVDLATGLPIAPQEGSDTIPLPVQKPLDKNYLVSDE